MNYIEGKKVIIITSRNLERIKYGKESYKCKFFEDLGIIAFKEEFWKIQECFNYFANSYLLDQSNVDYITNSDNTISICINDTIDEKYIIDFYLPNKIEEIQLAGLQEIINNIDYSKIASSSIHRKNDVDNVSLKFNYDIKDSLDEYVIKEYENNLKR